MSVSRPGHLALVGLLALTACQANPASAPPSSTEAKASEVASTSASPSAPVSDLVGEWARETRCEEIVGALEAEGLDAFVLDVAASFIPSGQVADPEDPCEESVPLRHSHFFTADGRFGSRDGRGNQVDDGTYQLIDQRTILIPREFEERGEKLDVTFHFTIEGDTILFEPVIPDCRPECFAATWSVTVAYPDHPWTRVDVARLVSEAGQ